MSKNISQSLLLSLHNFTNMFQNFYLFFHYPNYIFIIHMAWKEVILKELGPTKVIAEVQELKTKSWRHATHH